MASTEGKEDMSSSNGELKGYINPAEKRYLMAQYVLRIVAIVSAIASICVMVTSHQTVLLGGFFPTTARYKHSSAYRFLVGADAVAIGFCAVSLFFVWRLSRSKTQQGRTYFYIFLHDLVMMVLVAAGCAAATAIGYVGRYGEEKINWNAVCNYVGRFCNQILVAVLLSYVSFFSLFALTTLSAHKLISLPK